MKRVFYIHSGITWLVALGVIRELAFPPQDVLILYGRGLYFPCDFPSYKLDKAEQALAFIPSYGSRATVLSMFSLLRLDKRLSSRLAEGKFVVYLPTERNYLMQYLQTHRHCVGRNFLEEGLLTYNKSFVKHNSGSQSFGFRFRHALRFPLHFNRTLVGGKRPTRYSSENFTVYACTQTAQRALPEFLVRNVDVRHAIPIADVLAKIIGGRLFVFDPVVEKQICESSTFLSCLDDFVRNQFPPGTELSVKFHPQQKYYQMYLDIFNVNNICYTVVEQDVVPEVLLMSPGIHSVYGLCSSVLFYAKEWGHPVKTFSPALGKHSVSYRRWVEGSIPRFVVDYLQLL